MDLKNIFVLISQKGIDNVNLDMLPPEKRKEIYEQYGDVFKDEKGRDASYIAVKSYVRANNLDKAKERLISEIDYAARERRFKYCYYCSLLLENNEMASYFEQFINEAPDHTIDYTNFYFEIKKEMDKVKDGNNKV
jgi:hypothetical protein